MWPLAELARVLHLRAGCGVADPDGLKLNERALAIATKYPGPDNANLASMMTSLGDFLVYVEEERERGLQLLRDALAITREHAALAHKESWRTMALTVTLLRFGRGPEALPLARRLVEIETEPSRTFMHGNALLILGHALTETGNLDEALETLAQAKASGLEHHKKWIVRNAQQLEAKIKVRLDRGEA